MASPAQLMQVLSGATGVPLPTIVDIDRRLLKGKLRTKGGRGFNAARMTPLDAARLLTAVLGSPQANTSVDAVQRYAQTRVDRTRSSDALFGPVEIGDLARLPVRHSFVDALAGLIASAAAGDLSKLMAKSTAGQIPRIEVYAFARATRGRIRIAGLPSGLTAHVEYATPLNTKIARPKISGKQSKLPVEGGDLEQSRRVTERTILTIAELLAEESPDD